MDSNSLNKYNSNFEKMFKKIIYKLFWIFTALFFGTGSLFDLYAKEKVQVRKVDGYTASYLGGTPALLFYDKWNNELFVEKKNKTINILDKEGMTVYEIQLKEEPISFFVAKNGDIYLSDNQSEISILNYRGEYKGKLDLSSVPKKESIQIQSIHIDMDENIYIGDGGNARIIVLDKDGVYLRDIGGPGTDKGKFMNVKSITTDNTSVYALDPAMFRVSVFKKDGEFTHMFGQISSLLGGFSMPASIDTDGKWLFVVDSNRAMVIVFELTGLPITEFGGLGRDAESLMWPYDVKSDGKGRVYVSDSGNNELKVFEVSEPIDTDGDGVVDIEDSCPAEPGTAENNGCIAKAKDTDQKSEENKKAKEIKAEEKKEEKNEAPAESAVKSSETVNIEVKSDTVSSKEVKDIKSEPDSEINQENKEEKPDEIIK